MDGDNDIDTSGIPDFPPNHNGQWAKGPPQLLTDISQLRDIFVPVLTKESLVNQLYVEMMDKRQKNQTARVMAAKLIAELNGWIKTTTETKTDEDTSDLTIEEVRLMKEDFERSY